MIFRNSSDKGFTLLEVLVALIILSVGLVSIMHLFSGSLRSVRVSHDYSMAVFLARQKLEEILINPEFSESSEQGEFDQKYTWEFTAIPYEKPEPIEKEKKEEEKKFQLYQVEIKVSWFAGQSIGQRSVALQTLKVIPIESESEVAVSGIS